MPGGVENPFIGIATYTAIKYVGYTAYSLYINREIGVTRNVFLVGAVRTIMGFILGPILLAVTVVIPFLFWVGLIPMRIIEWMLLLRLMYGQNIERKKEIRIVTIGIVWSFILDIPAFFLGVGTSGFWVC